MAVTIAATWCAIWAGRGCASRLPAVFDFQKRRAVTELTRTRTGHAQSTVDRVIGVCAGGFRGLGHAIPKHLGECSILTAPARCLAPPKPPAQAQRASQPPLNGKWCTSGIKNFWIRTCRFSLPKLKECLKHGDGWAPLAVGRPTFLY